MMSESRKPTLHEAGPAALVPDCSRHCLLCGPAGKSVCYEAVLPEISAEKTAQVMHYQYEATPVSNSWHYRVIRCEECGHKYADPIVSRAVVESSYLLQDHDNEFGLDPELLRKTNHAYADLVQPYLSKERKLQVDIGCDTGVFVDQSRFLGYVRRVGIEPGVASSVKARENSGAEVMQKLFETGDFQAGTIGFASLIHVLDHIVDPRQLIREVHSRLAPDGTILAVVHNIDSFVAKISGESWAPLNLVHMDYFTPKTLRRLFELEGYEVQKVTGTWNYFPLHHLIRFSPFVPGFLRSRLVSLAKSPGLRSVVLGLKLGNIAIVAKRRA